MNSFIHDLRYAARILRQSPGFTVVAVLTLALGIGANTTIFGLVYNVLLQPLPYPQPDRIVTLDEGDSHTANPINVGYGTFADWQERSHSFSSMAAYRGWGPVMDNGGESELLRGMRVSYGFFRTLGVSPAFGRDFLQEEDNPTRGNEVILGYGFWQRQYGGDKSIVGRTIQLNDSPYTIVGVMPREFQLLLERYFSRERDLFAPLAYDRSLPFACRSCQHLQSIARLAPGVSIEQARDEMAAFQAQLIRDYPNDYPTDARTLVIPLQQVLTGKVEQAFFLLLGAVGLVLLIACANIANLLLARGIQRRRELAIRAALGAGRFRIVRQLLTESVLLGVIGGALGLLLASYGTRLVTTFGPMNIPRLAAATVPSAGLWFTGGVSIIAPIVFGLLPAVQITRVDLNEMLKEGQRGSEGQSGKMLRNLLVVAELSIALVLLVGSGLLLRSLGHLLDVNPGFDSHSVFTVNVSGVGNRFNDSAVAVEFFRQVTDRARKMPGVESVGYVNILPISGNYDRRGLHIQDRILRNVTDAPDVDRYVIGGDYFKTMHIPILRGRGFTELDTLSSPPVALINETTAHNQWPGENPIGKRIQLGGRSETDPWITIVGVVGDIRHYALDSAPTMQAYVPLEQAGDSGTTMVVRTSVSPASTTAAIRQAVSAVEKGQLVYGEETMDSLISESLSQRRFTLGLLGAFAGLALLLAVIGVYGVMAYSVESRRREFGIRLALGAKGSDVIWLVLTWSLRIIGLGLGIGVVASIAASRMLTSLLFEVQPTDKITIVVGAMLLVITGVIASYLPARRAAKVDPMMALRSE